MILSERAIPEVQAAIVSALSLPTTSIVVRATKFVRFDWRELVAYFNQNVATQGLQPPWCILRIGPEEEADWAMGTMCWTIPIEIFFIEDERDIVNTTCAQASSGNIQKLSSLTNVFVGQRLLWETAQVFGIVQSINTGASTVVTDVSITSTLNEVISSDIGSDVHSKVEILRETFRPGASFTNFQIVEDPVIDVSDVNPVNEAQENDNYSLMAGSCFAKLLVGETI